MKLDNKLYYSGNHNWNDFKNINTSIGARGTGKTFYFLYHAVKNKNFIWLRHTDKVVTNLFNAGTFGQDVIEKTDINPFHLVKNGDFTYIVDDETEDIIGYLSALSTFHNFRGANFENIDYIFFDEFIPESGAIIRKGYGDTFLNMYETVNRNRELEGKPPVKIFLLSNSEYVYSEIFTSLGIHDILEDMILEKQHLYTDDDLYLEIYQNDSFREQKKDTLLYRVANNKRFVQMALDNDFAIDKKRIKKKVDRKGSTPFLQIDNLTLIRLSNNQVYCISKIYKDDTIEKYDSTDKTQLQLIRSYFTQYLKDDYLLGNFYFDSIFTMKTFLDLL